MIHRNDGRREIKGRLFLPKIEVLKQQNPTFELNKGQGKK